MSEELKGLVDASAEIKGTKLEIQHIVGKVLLKHNIDYKADFCLKLSMPPYMD